MGQDIHRASYYLNPRFQYQHELGTNNELITSLRNVIIRLEPNVVNQAKAIEEVCNFMILFNLFSINYKIRMLIFY
jgi:hypothetical protein